MSAVTIKCFVYEVDYGCGAKQYQISNYDRMADNHWTLVGPLAVDYTIPADFNPVAAKVAALEAKKAQALAEYQQTVADLNRRLSELQALECVS